MDKSIVSKSNCNRQESVFGSATSSTAEPSKGDLKILDTLTDALGRSDGQTTEEVLADIRDDGVDADAVLARLHKFRLDIANMRYPKIGETCPDCGEILKDTPEDHSLWCRGRDDFDIEIVEGENGLKRCVLNKKDA